VLKQLSTTNKMLKKRLVRKVIKCRNRNTNKLKEKSWIRQMNGSQTSKKKKKRKIKKKKKKENKEKKKK
jgi:hypothetical protein